MAASQSLLDVFWSLDHAGKPLTTFQRVLLMTDGTVTDVLEAYVAEAIGVVKLSQSFSLDEAERPGMGLLEHERVLHRTVLLQGTISRINFIHGDSLIVPERLPAEVLDSLLATGKPIGRILAENRIETFREIVGLGFEPAGQNAAHFGVEATSPMVFRTYRIHVQKKPVMRISERFPVSWFDREM